MNYLKQTIKALPGRKYNNGLVKAPQGYTRWATDSTWILDTDKCPKIKKELDKPSTRFDSDRKVSEYSFKSLFDRVESGSYIHMSESDISIEIINDKPFLKVGNEYLSAEVAKWLLWTDAVSLEIDARFKHSPIRARSATGEILGYLMPVYLSL